MVVVQLRGVDGEVDAFSGHSFFCTSVSLERRLKRLVLADLPVTREEDPGLQVGS